jgi:3-methyladenine DNA glycosylase/8-oxoguanine DNA glycosylase
VAVGDDLSVVSETVIRPCGPFDLAGSARALGDGLRWFRDGTLWIALPEGEAHVRQGRDGALHVRVAAEDAEQAHAAAAFVLGADVDQRPFLRQAARDPLLRDVVARRRGVRPLRTATVAHALVKAVCGQLIQAREAAALERRIHRRNGGRPPRRDDLTRLAPAQLAALGLAPSRAEALVRTARGIDLERLHGHPTDRVVARIVAERGLGPWSAGVVTLYGLGRPEHGLVGDLGLIRLLRALRGGGSKPEGAETAALLEPYGPWAGWASLHLLAHPLARV